ncbi:MAG TPA: tetratricopeptide repeat protein [Lacunisphaera sp.]|nr:tetratricopeptide repeat protein [Lacunisphaera sp.]
MLHVLSSAATIRPPWLTWAAAAMLLGGTLLVFSRSLGYDFINYDDPVYVTENAQVQAGLTRESVVWAFTGRSDYWHPLTWLSHMLDWQLFGGNASAHRLVNVLWHAANAVLAFLLMRRLTGAFWTALVSAALFAWHPLRVESVVWITERKDVMSGFFFLGTLWTYAHYVERQRTGGKTTGIYLQTLACFSAGLMCKPMLVTLPVVMLILDFWPFGRLSASARPGWWRASRRALLEKIPFLGLAGLVSLATVLMQQHIGAFVLQVSAGDRLGNAVVSIARYFGKYFWPADLVICYPHPGSWPMVAIAGAGVVFAAVSVIAWRQRVQRPWIACGWLWFLVMLLPTIGILQVGFQAMADRYTYLPILGCQLAVLWTLRELPVGKMLQIGGSAAALLASVCVTWHQQGYWRDSLTLFQHAVDVDANNGFARGFLCFTLFKLGRLEEATREGELAVQLDPGNLTARYTLGCIKEQQGRIAEAATDFHRAVQLNPAFDQARYMYSIMLTRLGRRAEALAELQIAAAENPEFKSANIDVGVAEVAHGRPDQALAHFEVAIELDPQDVIARQAYAATLLQLGRITEAQVQLEAAVQLQPNHHATQVQLGLILLKQLRPAEAAGHFWESLKTGPEDPVALAGLGKAEEQLGQTAEATRHIARARELAPRDAEVARAWAEVLMRRGNYQGAVEAFQFLLAIRPDDAEAHAGIGYALILCKRPADAVAHWQEALRLRPDFPGLRERLERLNR